MAGLGDLVQKAIYLGIGMADYAAERAGMSFQELRNQAQKIADDLVARGEMSVEDARKYVDELIKQAQDSSPESETTSQSSEPRRIEIVSDDE
jgi:polyhydroxyalkanoate synthesis regulator phasin